MDHTVVTGESSSLIASLSWVRIGLTIIRPPFNSPLTSTQWLDMYGSVFHVPAHVAASRSLVACRGRVGKIELEGLADVLTL